MSLLTLLLTLSLSNMAPPPPPPMPIVEVGVFTTAGYVAHLAVAQDGQWLGTGDRKGTIGLDDLARLKLAAEQALITTTPGIECTTEQPIRVLRVAKGEARYTEGCGPQLHPTAAALVAMAEGLTIKRADPMVVRLDRWMPGKEDRKQSIILLRSGVWTTDNGAGNTGGQELADVIAAFDKAALDVSRRPNRCVADHIIELEVPGRARVRWTTPCDTPNASLQAALALLFKVVGLPR